MALSAADLQRRHQLEGAPDPFPSLAEPAPRPPKPQAPASLELDTDSEVAFPSLASSTPVASSATKPAWGSANGPRIKPNVVKAPVFTDSFTLSAMDLTNSGKDGKPATLGEVMKQVMAKYKVKVEASANQKARQTTFHIRAETQKELDKAKRSLLALLSPVITLVIQAPASTIASIIGPKGATLKQIRDKTSVRVDIPPRDSLAAPNGNGHANGTISGKATPSAMDDDEEPTVPVTLTGPQPLAYEAQALLNQIISSKTSKSTQRVRDIPAHVLPFVLARKPTFLAAAEGGDVNLSLNVSAREITVNGDREAVVRVVEAIKATVEGFRSNLTSLKISLPKRQHRLLVGKAVDEIMAKSKCAVVVADHDDPSDEVTVRGQGADLPSGLAAVMERANSQYIHEFPLPGPIATARQILTYMNRVQYGKTLSTAHPGVSVFFPTPAAVERGQTLTIDLVGEKSVVDAVVRQISELIGKLIGATKSITIDWLIHRVIIGKNAKKLKQFHDAHNVLVIFPNEAAEQSTVVLVYDPMSPSASHLPDDKKKHLDDVEEEVLKLAKDAADVKTEKVAVEAHWHDAVVGEGGTTLNALIGEDKTLSIKVGAEAGDPSTTDVILVRGASADVDKAVKEILKIVDNAKNDEIVNSHSTEFEIDKEYVGRIVGAGGAGINKHREQLGVKVDVSDDVDEKEKEGGKKKKAVHQKSKVKITGRQENVEEAKRRILSQVERLADETSEVLKIPSQYHSSLIGQSGKYANRLEEKYLVKITFPRQSAENGEGKTREQLKPDEVLIKGGKKGVAGAKAELLEAVEFEKESNNVLKFTVPTRSVARILGKGGASINEIKDSTEAQIDVEKASEGDGSVTNVTVRGTKKAINAAKAAILAIADQVAEETTATVIVESRFHRTLIGAGGQGLKELVLRCGGPSDPKLQAGLIRFPRQGEPSDEVKLRGEPKLVNKLKAELEKAVATLRDRVVLGVQIPAAQHRALIGRGGQHLNDLQNKRDVQIQFPGSRSYNQVGEPENAADLAGVDAANLVKVSGSRAACEATIEELKGQIKPPTPEGIVETVSVPLKYHHVISQQGNFFRALRSFGVQVDQSQQPTKSAVPTKPSSSDMPTARIDEAEDEAAPQIQWQVVPNYQDAEDGESVWTLKARDQAGLDRAQKLIQEAIDNAQRMSHVGFLTLPDRSVFPRIVGSKGANVARLRAETGADITVSRDDNIIVVIGSESAILAAKDAIVRMASNSGRSQRR
ncbi:putative K homology RNA-binding domain containing protein [Lyophyllum shimeji]|uniref:K homology RNA-binding domain containing protein n=1 Tax=Lyophyllum shimeji TaxID=47721 RepID=A0A9P3PKK8_LYOSH|nr:putative K homology RNA-binding domain containing protein [Lyophyllum shimeji]